jgi:integrase
VDAPSAKKKDMRTLTPEEVDTLLKVAEGSPYYAVIYTAVSSGLRQGELLALRWRDIDLELASMSISRSLYKRRGICIFKEPKTKHGRRHVRMTPKLALFLKSYRKQQEILYFELGKPLTLDELLFPNLPSGKPLDPSVVSHGFQRIARRAELEGVRFHDLRHTFASLMLLRGAKPKVISEALGHASVAFTMDTYSHIIDGMQQDAMALLDDVLPEGFVKSFVAESVAEF